MRSIVLAILLCATSARAGGDAPTSTTARAKVLYEEGMKWFNLHDFKQALDAFKQGYLTKADPSFLFNIGQCQRMMGDAESAAYSYRAYLREMPRAPNREEVEHFIAMMEDEIRRKASVAPPTGTIAPPPAEKPLVESHAPREAPPPVIESHAPREPDAAPAEPPRSDGTASDEQPIYKKWWLWTAVAAAVVVAAVAVTVGVLVGGPHDAPVPNGAFEVRF